MDFNAVAEQLLKVLEYGFVDSQHLRLNSSLQGVVSTLDETLDRVVDGTLISVHHIHRPQRVSDRLDQQFPLFYRTERCRGGDLDGSNVLYFSHEGITAAPKKDDKGNVVANQYTVTIFSA